MGTLLLIGILIISAAHAFTPKTSTQSKHASQQDASKQSRLRPLTAVAKSGGKMILTDEMYTENVLAKDIPRPVLVFFSAPW